jgi:DNA-binding beta-propeller fold protein YncE
MINDENLDSSLRLSYILSPNPNPVRASVSGSNPQIVDLEIIISNPLIESVEIDEIIIEIPMGADNARSLSAAPKLPQPDTKTSGPWTIKVDAEKISITPTVGDSGHFKGEVVIFKLKGIQVNNTPGAVPITVTEYADSDSVTDSYQLSKLEPDFPVAKFYAEPDTLSTYDKVKFIWKCSDQGKNYKYSVYPKRTKPQDCRDLTGECKSCADGDKGVLSDKLEKTTTFNLDVLKAESTGGYSVYKTLTTTVRVEVPQFNPSYEWIASASGRLLQLGWIAQNAAKCTVELGGAVIDENAPTYTDGQGYMLMITDKPGTYPVSLNAVSRDGKRKASLQLSSATVKDPVGIKIDDFLGKVAVTPDSKLAFLLNTDKRQIIAIDVPNKKLKTDPIPLPDWSFNFALTPDGKQALIHSSSGINAQFFVLDTETLKLRSDAIKIDKTSLNVVFAPDGKKAFIDHTLDRCISVMDMTTFKVSKTFKYDGSMYTWAFNITPDGKYILTVMADDGTGITYFRVIDASKLEFVGEPVPIGICLALCATADSKYVLAPDFIGRCVRVIEIASRKIIGNPIPVAIGAMSIALTHSGKFAFVEGLQENALSIINMETFESKTVNMPIGIGPHGMAATPDGTLLVNSLTEGLKFI